MNRANPPSAEEAQRLAANDAAVAGCAADQSPVLHLDIWSLDELPEVVWTFTWLEELRLTQALQTLTFNDWERTQDNAASGQSSRWPEQCPLIGLKVLVANGLSLTDDALRSLSECIHLSTVECAFATITTAASLATLKSLQTLNLSGCGALTNVDGLAGLTELQFLDLSGCVALTIIDVLSGLKALQSLNLRDCRVLEGVDVLSGLKALQSLDLSRCFSLTNVDVLSELTGLQTLRLSQCWALTNIDVLAGLTALQSLNLAACSALTNIDGLAGLTALQSLVLHHIALTSVDMLSALTALQSLDLSFCHALTNVDGLAGLTALQSLDLGFCRALTNIDGLAGLTALRSLNLSGCGRFECRPNRTLLARWPALHEFYADELAGAPNELASEHSRDNCWPRIMAWQRDLHVACAPDLDLKLFVLGNGRVGKTQLCRRLTGMDFDSTLASTHGVMLGRFRLQEATSTAPAIDINFWDFGGQDVYLGTHALFLDAKALYLLAWSPAYEQAAEFEQHGVPMRDRPLRYWLDYIRSLAGTDAPLVVTQTQCDQESMAREPPIPMPHGFARLQRTVSSAKREDGMDVLVPELKRAARYLREQSVDVELPLSWVAVMNELLTLRAGGQKLLAREAFDTLCRDTGHVLAPPTVVLEYLHRGGQVFWREGAFGNDVVLDLAWAFDAIYTLLERHRVLPLLRQQRGRFSPQLLAAIAWGKYTETEQKLFLSMMVQSQICFALSHRDGEYVAVALLPPRTEVAAQLAKDWHGRQSRAIARLSYEFLHEAILRAVLCKLGGRAGHLATYWAYGICYWDADAGGVVEVCADLAPDAVNGHGAIRVEASGEHADKLVEHLVSSIQSVRIGSAPTVAWLLGGRANAGKQVVEAQPNAESKAAFSEARPGPPPHRSGDRHEVWVSYAWGGQSDRFVNDLEQRLDPRKFLLRRDRNEMKPGDSIGDFMRALAQGEFVVVVLSDKSVRSHYCMRELLGLWRRCDGDPDLWKRHVIPIVCDDLQLGLPRQRAVYAKYWLSESKELIASQAELGPAFGKRDLDALKNVEEFKLHVSDMLAWAADVLMPRGETSVEAALTLLSALPSLQRRL